MGKRRVIGLMSGTSLDGLDICATDFDLGSSNHEYNILATSVVELPGKIFHKLQNFNKLTVSDVQILHKELGRFYGDAIEQFLHKEGFDKKSIDAIACHGQTVLHQPENGFSLQIGCGHELAQHTKINVINDFRNRDIAAGGQGAPLVPVGDFGLFHSQADCFLNLGGFSNVSYKDDYQSIKAYDISPANLPMNTYMHLKGETYDRNGETAASGTINKSLLEQLNNLAYYQLPGPKSLGTEWLENQFYPCISKDIQLEDILATLAEHCAFQIGQNLDKIGAKRVMVTGGGTRNRHLMERIKEHYSGSIILPNDQLIDYKEALIFGYLGALYLENLPNALGSVTGASINTINGVFYKG